MPNPNRYLDRDCNLLRTYGYDDSGMLRQTLHVDSDLYVVSASYIMGKRVGDTYYLAGSVMFRPVSRNYWLRTMREWARFVTPNTKESN